MTIPGMDNGSAPVKERSSRRKRQLILFSVGGVVLVAAAVAVAVVTGITGQQSGALTTASAVKVNDTLSIGSSQVKVTSGATQGAEFVGAGALTAGPGSGESVQLRFTDSNNWSVTVVNAAAGKLNFGAVQIIRTAITGGMSASGGVVTSTLAAQLAAPAIIIDSKFVLTSGTIAFSATCPTTTSTRLCVDGSSFALLSGVMSESFGSPVASNPALAFTATINMSSGVANLQAPFASDETASISQATIKNMTLLISAKDDSFAVLPADSSVKVRDGSANGGLNIQIAGKGKLVMPKMPLVGWDVSDWNSNSVALTYVNGGLVLTGKILPGTVGTSSVTDFAYFNAEDTLATIYGNTLKVPRRTMVLGVASNNITFPALVGLPGLKGKAFDIPVGKEGMFMMYTSNGNITAGWTVPTGVKLPSFSDDYTFSFTPATISVSLNTNPEKLQAAFSFAQNGLLSISGKSGNVRDIAVSAKITYEFTKQEINLSISANGLDGKSVWPNVVGIEGLDLNGFAISGTISTSGVPLGIGLAGDGVLSGNMARLMNNSNSSGADIPIKFVANLVLTAPCFEIAIGDPDGTTKVINLGPGLISATYVQMYAAPLGCTVGTYIVPAGFSVTFRGEVIGVDTDVWIAINTNSPISLNGSARIGTIGAAGFSLRDTSVAFALGGIQMQSFDLTGTVSGSTQWGNSTLGLKAEFGGTVTIDYLSAVNASIKYENVEADAYYGLAGWKRFGSPSTYISGNNVCISKKLSGKTRKVCLL